MWRILVLWGFLTFFASDENPAIVPSQMLKSWDILEGVYTIHQNEWIILSGCVIDKILSTTGEVQFQGKIRSAGALNYNSQNVKSSQLKVRIEPVHQFFPMDNSKYAISYANTISPIDICTDMSKNVIWHVFEHEAVLRFQRKFMTELSNWIGYLI